MEKKIEITQAEYDRLRNVESLYRYHLSMLRTIIMQGETSGYLPNRCGGLCPDRAHIEPNPEAKALSHDNT